MTHRIQTLLALLLFAARAAVVQAFPTPFLHTATTASTRLHAAGPSDVASVQVDVDVDVDVEAIAAERFVVTNQFKVRKGREAAFEKRWADRESRLGTLDGFRFFCILRRVDDEDATDDINYVSCTVWETFDNFQAWKTGDAFKEAHGGGTVGGVASMLLATARNTKGKPVPAYFRGLLPLTSPATRAGTPPKASEGWRKVTATGRDTLDEECFVAMNRFSVSPKMGGKFEQRFANRDSVLTDFDGFRGFMLLRRDGGNKPGDDKAPKDGYTHSTFSVWKNKASFDAWRSSEKKPGKPDAGAAAAAAGPPAATAGAGAAGGPTAGRPNIFEKPPVASFYEGILVLESAKGL